MMSAESNDQGSSYLADPANTDLIDEMGRALAAQTGAGADLEAREILIKRALRTIYLQGCLDALGGLRKKGTRL